MAEKRPNRTLGPHHNTFWEYCNKGELRLQKCNSCGGFQWPPSPICSHCSSQDLTWTEVKGAGKILTHCVFEKQYYPECVPPWPVIVVELEEGPLLITNPKGMTLDQLKRGTPVTVTFVDCEDAAGAFKLPVFQKALKGKRVRTPVSRR